MYSKRLPNDWSFGHSAAQMIVACLPVSRQSCYTIKFQTLLTTEQGARVVAHYHDQELASHTKPTAHGESSSTKECSILSFSFFTFWSFGIVGKSPVLRNDDRCKSTVTFSRANLCSGLKLHPSQLLHVLCTQHSWLCCASAYFLQVTWMHQHTWNAGITHLGDTNKSMKWVPLHAWPLWAANWVLS